MPPVQNLARGIALLFVPGIVLATAWGSLIAGLAWILADGIGAGQALRVVGGGLIVLIALPVSTAAMARNRTRHEKQAALSAEVLSTVLALARIPGGPRLMLVPAAVLLALLALCALRLATGGAP